MLFRVIFYDINKGMQKTEKTITAKNIRGAKLKASRMHKTEGQWVRMQAKIRGASFKSNEWCKSDENGSRLFIILLDE